MVHWVWALALAMPALTAATQIPFQPSADAAPHSPFGSADTVKRYTFNDRDQAQQAKDWVNEHGLDLWTSSASKFSLDLRLNPRQEIEFNELNSPKSCQILIPSIQQHFQNQPAVTSSYNSLHSTAAIANMSQTRLHSLQDSIHDSFHDYGAITQILRQFSQQFPDLTEMFSIGQSSEGREIWALRVTNLSSTPIVPDVQNDVMVSGMPRVDATKRKKKKPSRKHPFVIVATQHAREWIAPSTSLYLIHDLLLSAHSDAPSAASARNLLDLVEFIFIPVVNVDGYEYSWTADRLWRKNRQSVGKNCFGIDLNRNWGTGFDRGTRPNPCSDAYPGEEPFQSLELKHLSQYLLDPKNGIKAFLDLHSFGQMLLFPYSFSCSHKSPDEENHFEGVVGAAKSLRAVHGRSFEVGSVCEVSLTAPGESLDWTYKQAKIRWSFAAELRDSGVFGFLLPPSQIRPSGEEFSAALTSLATFVVNKEAGQRFDFD